MELMQDMDEFGPIDEYSLGWKIASPAEPGPEIAAAPAATKTARVFGFSDLHVDYKENYQWCDDLSSTEFKDDVLLLAGDLTNDLAKMRAVLAMLRPKFAEVFFVPGNHDVWVRGGRSWRVAPQQPLALADPQAAAAAPTDSLGQLDAVCAARHCAAPPPTAAACRHLSPSAFAFRRRLCFCISLLVTASSPRHPLQSTFSIPCLRHAFPCWYARCPRLRVTCFRD